MFAESAGPDAPGGSPTPTPNLPSEVWQALRCQPRWLPSEVGTLLGPHRYVRGCSPHRT